MSLPIKKQSDASDPGSQSLGTSYRSQYAEQSVASIAEESILRDLADVDGTAFVEEDDARSQEDHPPQGSHSMAGNYRQPSHIATNPRPFLGALQPETVAHNEQGRGAAIDEERCLLRDNNLIPPKHSGRRESGASSMSGRGLLNKMSMSFASRKSTTVDEESVIEHTETTGLLEDRGPTDQYRSALPSAEGECSASDVGKKWEEAVRNGEIKTTWRREAKVLARYSGPLIPTFLLQQSLTLTSIFTVGQIGVNELGAVSLGGMTASITGYAVYYGLATSLDTLCAQAYGSGRKKLVGLQLQRMVFFLWVITIPISIIWLCGAHILAVIVPEQEIAVLAGQYLKILVLGAPGYAAFEAGKRYVQAQGRFEATLYVLLIAAPLNMFMHWLFVWKLEWGFVGCPIAVVITENLMPVLLFLYVRFSASCMDCWGGFTRKAFSNWGPMIRLALPGLVMVMAEFLAFEVLTLAAARISATHLAANTIILSLSVLVYCIPFPVSIAASTRVANLIGAGLPDAAKTAGKVAYAAGTVLGLLNMLLLALGRHRIPSLFSDDAEVVALAAATLPINAAFQLFDSLAGQGNGLLRGLGKQEVGGYINLVAYYAVRTESSFVADVKANEHVAI